MRFWMAGMVMSLAALAAHAQVESARVLDTGSGQLHGTLMQPEGAPKAPLVLIIAGSGPTDRDGNSPALAGKNESLKLLAQGLAKAGIASLRYDKRGIAASAAAGPAEDKLRFEHYVDDAVAWANQLKNDPAFASVALIGHSEGSLIALLAAQRAPVTAVVSIAGPARGAADILRTQLQGKLPPALAADNERILRQLQDGQGAQDPAPALAALYRPSVQPYLISWFRYTPATEIAKLQQPVLVVQGSTDLQVSIEEAKQLAAAKPKARLAIIEGMNHVLKSATGGIGEQMPTYVDPSRPLAPGLMEALTAFLNP